MTDPRAISDAAMKRFAGFLVDDAGPSPSSMPNILGHYRLVRPVAEGASGRVYEARDLQLNRRVAVKILHPEAAAHLQRFMREASLAARLQHPGIITVHEVSMVRRSDGAPLHFIVMDYYERTLEDLLRSRQAPRPDLLRLLENVARAVHHAHDNGVVHRDLKPANILLDGPRAVVSDFGLAREETQVTQLTRSGAPIGTPSYMSPEQAAGRTNEIGPASDLFSLGVMLYRILAGRLPFEGDGVAEVYSAILSKEPLPPGAGRDLDTICLKAIEKDRERRYASALEFADDLRRAISGEPILARPPGTLRRLRRASKSPAVWATALVGLALVAAVYVAQRDTQASKQVKAADDVQQVSTAWFDLHFDSQAAMQALEDVYFDAADRDDAAVEKVELAAASVARRNPAARSPRSWRALARFLHGDGRALADLEAAAAEAGTDPFPHLLLARARFTRYTREAHIAAASHPETGTADIRRFRESPEMKTEREASREALSRAVASPLWPRLDRGAEYLAFAEATTLIAAEEFAKAASALESLRDHAVLGAHAESLRAACLCRAGRFDLAAEAWERVARRGWYWLHVAAALARFEAGQADAGLADAQLAARRKPSSTLPLLLIVTGEKKKKEWARAIVVADRALAIDADLAGAYLDRGFCHLRLSEREPDPKPRLERAVADFRSAVERDAEGGDSWSWFGVALRTQAEALDVERLFQDAVTAGHESVKWQPAVASHWLELGNSIASLAEHLERHGGDPVATFDRAIEAYSKALSIRADYAPATGQRGNAWLNKAAALAARDQDAAPAYERALADFNETLSRDPDEFETYTQRGLAHAGIAVANAHAGRETKERFDSAILDFTKALSFDKENVRALYSRGLAWRSRGDHEEPRVKHYEHAVADFRAARTKDPRHLEAWGAEAQIFELFQKWDDAATIYEEALKHFPGHPVLTKRLEAARSK
jgi:tRNA A-37 threonylcarbamoyl transferase component Bud32/Flp pilus assembly protein TadD